MDGTGVRGSGGRLPGELRSRAGRSAPPSPHTTGARRWSTCGVVSPTQTHRRAVGRGHARARVLDDQGRRRPCAPTGSPSKVGLDVDAPVVTYWPEFAPGREREGDRRRSAGAPRRPGVGRRHDDVRAKCCAGTPSSRPWSARRPRGRPGPTHGYHATTFGWLVGEVVRRVTGKSIGTYLRDEIAGPLGAEFFIGLPADEGAPGGAAGVVHRRAPHSPGEGLAALAPDAGSGPGVAEMAEMVGTYLAPDGPLSKAMCARRRGVQRRRRMARPPLARGRDPGGQRHLRRAFTGVSVRGLRRSTWRRRRASRSASSTPEQLDRATVQKTQGPDVVLMGLDIQWGLGFKVNTGMIGLAGLGGPRSFGHFGMGGSAGWARPRSPPGHGICHEQDGDRHDG